MSHQSHTPRSNQHDRTVLNNAQLNVLVDQVFSRVINLAQSRPIHFNPLAKQYELETIDVKSLENINEQNIPQLDVFLPDDSGAEVKFMVLNHTCPICLVSFENAKFLVRHFTNEHVVAKQTYKCSICTEEKYLSIDDYFKHCLGDELHLDFFLVNDFRSFYSLFLVKFVQDMIVNHFVNGSYCLLKLRNSTNTPNNKQSQAAIPLLERMSTKMNETFFGRPSTAATGSSSSTSLSSSSASSVPCKPCNCLSSKSIRSNQACNNKRVSQSDLIAEILKYAQLEPNSKAAVYLKSQAELNEISYLQCSLCFTLLNDHPDDLKMHIVQAHCYNESLNKCMVCCYCRQILKSNNEKVSVLDVFNHHVMSNECSGVRRGQMPIAGADLFGVVAKAKQVENETSSSIKAYSSNQHADIVEDENGLIENEYMDEEEAALARDLNDDEVDFEGDTDY